jgi:UDP-N-acetylglucosamine--N-acetylmuramyl-(pentapeptide) pyrophosphoryl-undecaprenol N-acetylglucosamine transferase
MRPVIITAGGTGGHVFPALAVADYLAEKGIPLLWLGSSHGLEARVVPAKGYELITIKIGGLRGKGIWRRIVVIAQLSIALPKILVLLARVRPAAMLGMGGFVSGPAGVAAWLMRVPLLIHEQNAIAGLTNRLLAPLATRVMQAFPGTFVDDRHAFHTGNPVRRDILDIEPPQSRLTGRNSAMRILVIGGSQGASSLNCALPLALADFESGSVEVWHQSGERERDATATSYKAQGTAAKVEAFIEQMSKAYAWADIVVCRSGALTVSELSAAGVASVLVPFPLAVDDHQTANGRYLSDKDASVLVCEPPADRDSVSQPLAERLAQILAQFSATRSRLVEMACRARQLAVPDATRRVGDLCMEVAAGV